MSLYTNSHPWPPTHPILNVKNITAVFSPNFKSSFPGSSLAIENCQSDISLENICHGNIYYTQLNTYLLWTKIQS